MMPTSQADKVKYPILVEHDEKRTVTAAVPSNADVRCNQHDDWSEKCLVRTNTGLQRKDLLTRFTRDDDPKYHGQQVGIEPVWYASWDVSNLIWQN